jgi:hypothetical protein
MYILTSRQYPRKSKVRVTAVNWFHALCYILVRVNVTQKETEFL